MYLDSFSGLIPCRPIAVSAPDSVSGTVTVTVRLLRGSRNKAYKAGEEVQTLSRYIVYRVRQTKLGAVFVASAGLAAIRERIVP